jgi:hypothetical protein
MSRTKREDVERLPTRHAGELFPAGVAEFERIDA